ncbi:hypothetical protein C5167_007431 [Papaver somniferum]|nr:hypothetical protein C5167_007431 [Papaver somniferum]
MFGYPSSAEVNHQYRDNSFWMLIWWFNFYSSLRELPWHITKEYQSKMSSRCWMLYQRRITC